MTTTTPVTMTSRERFITDLNILLGAAVGVTAIRTREPFAVRDIIKSMAFSERETAFKFWTMTNGWGTYARERDRQSVPTYDDTVQPMAAITKIMGKGPSDAFPDDGYYCMMWPHFPMKNSSVPPFIQATAELAYILPETNRRLLFVVPPEFEVPKELEDCLTILDHDAPGSEELREVYDRCVMNISEATRRPKYKEHEIIAIVNAGMGMTLSEFESAVTRAIVEHRQRLPGVPAEDLRASVSMLKTQVVKRSEVLEVMETVDISSVGGLDELKAWLADRKDAFTPEAAAMGVDRPKGMALIGPPGTGKSLAGKATAAVLELPLIKFDISRVFAGLVGASESRTRGALKLIEALSPCVVLLDEVDKAFNMNSGGGDSGVGMRVLGAVLTHMQESKKPIFWIMTANRVAGLPPEILRKGRLDEVWSVSTPTAEERKTVFEIHLRMRGWDPAEVEDLDIAVAASNGFVSAEIEAAVKEAITVHYSTWKRGGGKGKIGAIGGELLAAQLGQMKPLSVAFATQFREMEDWADNNARAASTFKKVATEVRSRPRPALPEGGTGRRMIRDASVAQG